MNDNNDKMKKSVASFDFESKATNQVTVKGTLFKKGMFVLLGKDEELHVGRIKLIIVNHDCVYFVLRETHICAIKGYRCPLLIRNNPRALCLH